MRISDWSSDVCSSDLDAHRHLAIELLAGAPVIEVRLARRIEPRHREHRRHVAFARAVEHRGAHRDARRHVLREFDDLGAVTRLDVVGIVIAIDLLQSRLDRLGHRARRRIGIGLAPFFERLRALLAELPSRPAGLRLENLADDTKDGPAKRVEDDHYPGSVREENVALLRQAAAAHSSTAVAAGHYYTRPYLTPHPPAP